MPIPPQVIVAGVTFVAERIKGWVSGFDYDPVDGTGCPGCRHGPTYRRQVGMIGFRHDQYSCVCRLARQGGHDPNCGCEWTLDVD